MIYHLSSDVVSVKSKTNIISNERQDDDRLFRPFYLTNTQATIEFLTQDATGNTVIVKVAHLDIQFKILESPSNKEKWYYSGYINILSILSNGEEVSIDYTIFIIYYMVLN
jgi:hypothetical protein